MVDRFEKRLAGWKKGLLSKGDRLRLIKSTLDNLPIYYMSLLTILKSVVKKLEVVQSRFLWVDTGERQIHLVAWSELKKSLHLGRLGLQSL